MFFFFNIKKNVARVHGRVPLKFPSFCLCCIRIQLAFWIESWLVSSAVILYNCWPCCMHCVVKQCHCNVEHLHHVHKHLHCVVQFHHMLLNIFTVLWNVFTVFLNVFDCDCDSSLYCFCCHFHLFPSKSRSWYFTGFHCFFCCHNGITQSPMRQSSLHSFYHD